MLIDVGLEHPQQTVLHVGMTRFGGEQDDVLSLEKFVLLAILSIFFEFFEGQQRSGGHNDGLLVHPLLVYLTLGMKTGGPNEPPQGKGGITPPTESRCG
jgi:hypothetical protein